ncbi:thioredoxin family protein [Halolactibacillus miurensis]|uniref:Small redox-active disulfide protein 2 n=1 Tax=Halolactibacillus miurensis TaxID=306541 RepID=A0A1I6V4G6_9BACI|nr:MULTISPECIES: thioredoxin family protein [Halolactibacillus]GEM05916.1 thioredoxin family protein [Halolactibacillus miurensis]SFT08608.1 small redox-active disulfide protein 2 [Halolactibacillus miurensis]
MIIKILGPGCKKCEKLEKNTKDALETLSVDFELVKITDSIEIQKYGVMRTPALVINDKVVVSGRVPKTKEIEKLINIATPEN